MLFQAFLINFYLSYFFMFIGTLVFEYSPTFSPELQLFGVPTLSAFWFVIFSLPFFAIFFTSVSSPFYLDQRIRFKVYSILNISIFFLFLLGASVTLLGFTSRYNLPSFVIFSLSFIGPLIYLVYTILFLDCFCSNSKVVFYHRLRPLLFNIFLFLICMLLLSQKGTPFGHLLFSLLSAFFASIKYNFSSRLRIFNNLLRISIVKISKINLIVFSFVSTFIVSVLLNLASKMNNTANENIWFLTFDYLLNRVGRQGQLFSYSFIAPLFPNHSNTLSYQLFMHNSPYSGMQGTMNFIMPLDQRIMHEGSLAMLFPANLISTCGPFLSLFVSYLLIFPLVYLLTFLVRLSLSSSNYISFLTFILFSSLFQKYLNNILLRGDLSNFVSPYFFSLFISASFFFAYFAYKRRFSI